ncbi:MAG: hypothetical protein U1E06_19825 [Tabrizicola sp.]|uniref:hypothetical protein n=1 Tax=Tabrizicola sp. TaxID=2005166 RepID=UPI0027323ABF|nr:hypothetical protein [Tabrizicola sp.]MDP3263473.1 hypothetical protein [Tabrizicola sp.]MDP3646830.1 hypothetical protein [Paracoccaceae bacterium]MDZ4069056.1 hypothetical protein [Tabrizicola sp.]
MTYESQCQFGRAIAASEIDDCKATGNYPKLIRAIREMADQSHGVSIGFLQAIAEKAARR